MKALRSQLLRRINWSPENVPKSINSTKVKPLDGISIRGDIVGQPSPISNIRPIIFNIPDNETLLEKEFRLKREEVLQWHEKFWSYHNTRFIKERKEFIESRKAVNNDTSPLSPDEISIFYKGFLDKHWKTHMWYNIEWYKHNMKLLTLSFKVELDRAKRKVFD